MWKPKIVGSLTGEGLDDLRLCGARCDTCGRIFFPFRKNCPHCLIENTVKRVSLSNRGKLYSFVVCTMAPPGYTVPHAQGYIDIDDSNVRIFSLLVDYEDQDKLRAGMDMEVVFQTTGKDADGNEVVDYKFRPVRKLQGRSTS